MKASLKEKMAIIVKMFNEMDHDSYCLPVVYKNRLYYVQEVLESFLSLRLAAEVVFCISGEPRSVSSGGLLNFDMSDRLELNYILERLLCSTPIEFSLVEVSVGLCSPDEGGVLKLRVIVPKQGETLNENV